MNLNDDVMMSAIAFSVDPSVTESQDGVHSEFSMSGPDVSSIQRGERKVSRITYQKVLNLKALIDATRFIDTLMGVQGSEIQFNTQKLPVLRNTYNTHELIKQAEDLLEKMSKTVAKAPVTAISTTKMDFTTDTKVTTKRAVTILSKIFQAENRRFVDIFTFPVSRVQLPRYYDTIKHPMCFAFIALRMKSTQEEGDFIEDRQLHQNILLDNPRHQYGSMVEQVDLFQVTQEVKSFAQLMKSPVYNKLIDKPKPYTSFDEILADLLLIAADCLYFNNHNEHYCTIGRLFFETVKDVFEKQNLWNDIYNDLLEIDIITKVCMKVERNSFDDLKIDELSDETVKQLIKLLGPEDSETSREGINNMNMNRTLAYIEEKQLLQRQSKQRVLTMKEFSNNLQLTQAGTDGQKNSVDEQNVLFGDEQSKL